MTDSPESRDPAVLCDFLDLFLEDRAAGRRRPLAEYLRRFPGHEESVAREYFALDAADGAEPSGPRAPEGDVLGHYRLIEQLGRGGQGTVFLAEDVRLSRHVALKILDGGVGGLPATRLARLKREAEALSRLDHPRLCALYDLDLGGERPWFAMRYVPGETLAERIGRARSEAGGAEPDALLGRMPESPREIEAAVRFVEQAARAVHVAHEAGIVHRDLKPGNIMIDRESEPVVLDFGLARDLGQNGAVLTISGDAFGTLGYMSPEQLSGEHEIDRRTDVYSLGVTLYECLTFRRPVEAATRESLLKGILGGIHEDPMVLNPSLPRDLAVVLGCALDVDRARRYPTSLAFAEDLRRVREHEPILARPAGWWTLTRRWAERHPAAFAGGLATFTLLVAGLAITIGLLARVTREQAQTRQEQAKLMALRQAYLAQVLGNEKPALALRVGIDAARRERHAEINNILYDLLDRCYEKATWVIGMPPSWLGLGYEPLFDARGRLLVAYAGGIASFDLATGARRDLVAGRAEEQGLDAPHLAISKDRTLLASAHADGSLMLWDLGATPVLRETRPTALGAATWVEFAPGERRVAMGSDSGAVAIHDVGPAGAAVTVSLADHAITTARFDPAGARIAVSGLLRPGGDPREPGAAVFDAATGSAIARLGASGTSAVWSAWSRDGRRLAVAIGPDVKVFRTADWTEEASLTHGGVVYWAEFHPDDRRLVTGSVDGLSAWDVAAGRRIATVEAFRGRSVIRGAFDPDGTRLAVISWDQTASIVECDTWLESRKLKGLGRPRGVCWSPDGSVLATTDEASNVRLWHPAARPELPVLRGHEDRVVGASFSPDGTRALTASLDGSARIFDAGSSRLLCAMKHGRPLAAAAFTQGGEVLTVGGGRAVLWKGDGSLLRELAHEGSKLVHAWPRSRGRVFGTFEDCSARLWDAATGEVVRTFEGHRGPIMSAAFHDGRGWIATGGSDRTVRVVEVETGRSVRTLEFAGPGRTPAGTDLGRVFTLSFDGTGDRIIAGCEDLRLRVWDLRTGRLEREDAAATPGLLALDATGRWLVTGSKWLGRVFFLDLNDPAAALRPALFHDSHMTAALGVSPKSDFAMAASKDGTVRLWTMDGIRPHAVFEARCGVLFDAAFSPDGSRVIVAGSDGTARVWPVDPLPVAERVCPVSNELWEVMRPTLDQALFSR